MPVARSHAMPNLTFLVLHFFHTMALALWVGGIVALGLVAAPVTFDEAPERRLAGRIFGRVLRRFDAIVAACIVALAVTSILMVKWFGRWSPWYAIEYVCIALMSGSATYTMAFVSPRLRRLRDRDRDGHADADAEEFERLHRLAVLTMQFDLACGTVAILFS